MKHNLTTLLSYPERPKYTFKLFYTTTGIFWHNYLVHLKSQKSRKPFDNVFTFAYVFDMQHKGEIKKKLT